MLLKKYFIDQFQILINSKIDNNINCQFKHHNRLIESRNIVGKIKKKKIFVPNIFEAAKPTN